MSRIQKRTKNIRDSIEKEWKYRWWQFINDNPNNSWDWNGISDNSNITMEFINEYQYEDWDWYVISMHPNITIEDILNNPKNPWCWSAISMNTFTKEKEEFIEQKYREHLAAIFIQNAYKNALVNPNCHL